MIFVTGDTHGDEHFLKLKELCKTRKEELGKDCKDLTRDDYVIIAGDFGGVWHKGRYNQDLHHFKRLPYTVLFVDGNHENFDILDAMPVEIWKGGKVHRVAKNIIHLMRGQVFTIEGKTFFTFGGAESVDKDTRTEGASWWPQEVPTEADYAEAYKNLEAHGNKADYIITHTIDERALDCPQLKKFLESKGATETNRGLSGFEKTVDYKHWFFGHYHIEAVIPRPKGETGASRKSALFNKFIEITDGGLK